MPNDSVCNGGFQRKLQLQNEFGEQKCYNLSEKVIETKDKNYKFNLIEDTLRLME